MKQHYINELDNFMGAWYLDDTSICDRLIDFHKNSPNQHQGTIGKGVNPSVKDSTDVELKDDIVMIEYFDQLKLVTAEYIKKYPWCNGYNPFALTQVALVQHYKPTSAYFGWHSERIGTREIATTRHLVFMTYLNDVDDGGETEWFHQNLKIKPEKGLTVIWPTDWTFTHRGVASPTQDKYIVTGWFNFID